MTDSAQERLRSFLKAENRASLRLVTGADGRIRLALDRRLENGDKENHPGAKLLLPDNKTTNLSDNVTVDVVGQGLVIKWPDPPISNRSKNQDRCVCASA